MIRLRCCRRCHEIKPWADFDVRGNGRLDCMCRACRARVDMEAELEAYEQAERKLDERRVRKCVSCGEVKPVEAFLPGFAHCRECQRRRRG